MVTVVKWSCLVTTSHCHEDGTIEHLLLQCQMSPDVQVIVLLVLTLMQICHV